MGLLLFVLFLIIVLLGLAGISQYRYKRIEHSITSEMYPKVILNPGTEVSHWPPGEFEKFLKGEIPNGK